MSAPNVLDLGVQRDIREGFKDNHGRTWWNFRDGRRALCRLKYPSEFNAGELPEEEAAP